MQNKLFYLFILIMLLVLLLFLLNSIAPSLSENFFEVLSLMHATMYSNCCTGLATQHLVKYA